MATNDSNKQIGNYRVVNELASGSFGRVYLAHHVYLTNRAVAIKILHALVLPDFFGGVKVGDYLICCS